MKANKITIKNFRSIEEISLDLKDDGGFHTFGLIGVNEAGKSSILNAIRNFHDLSDVNPRDFRDKTKPVEVSIHYKIDEAQWRVLCDGEVTTLSLIPNLSDINPNLLVVKIYFSKELDKDPEWAAEVEIPDFGAVGVGFDHLIYDVIFWTAEEKYLITKPVDLNSFSLKPHSVSVPLQNCFLIAGINDIKSAINQLTESTDIEALEEQLSHEVTKHISSIWPNHPISITFKINNNTINFHVRDKEVKSKAKTAEQRSDGFRQFVSFLLTISAQSVNKTLDNSIIVIDEPETHLHPQAQIFFLEELKRISKDNSNTVIFSTHSNYMIDRDNIDNYFRVVKNKDMTKISPINKSQSSYSSVNFHVFNIESNDYFIELYSRLHEIYIDSGVDEAEKKKRETQTSFNENYLHAARGLKKNKPYKASPNSATLPCYVRNCINHPEAGNSFTREELRKSIEDLYSFLEDEV